MERFKIKEKEIVNRRKLYVVVDTEAKNREIVDCVCANNAAMIKQILNCDEVGEEYIDFFKRYIKEDLDRRGGFFKAMKETKARVSQ